MLRVLGYDPLANPPNYGEPDPNVADNTIHIKKNADFWKQKELDVLNQGSRDDGHWPQQEGQHQQQQQDSGAQNTDTGAAVEKLSQAEPGLER